MTYHDLIIIGGGASGLMAAILAKDYGIDTAIVEGSDRVGKKILTTGNGRCNVTNKYIYRVLVRFFNIEICYILNFIFNNIDIYFKT